MSGKRHNYKNIAYKEHQKEPAGENDSFCNNAHFHILNMHDLFRLLIQYM